jgi:hypothetical protein
MGEEVGTMQFLEFKRGANKKNLWETKTREKNEREKKWKKERKKEEKKKKKYEYV